VQHDLGEPHQGRLQLRRLSVALLAAALLAGCGGGEEPSRQILVVSGRDDHGLLAQERVALSHAPDGSGSADGHGPHEVADGTLVRVVESRNEWIHVETLEGPRTDGWVNDYYLRGVVHVCADGVPRSAQAEIVSVGDDGVRERTLISPHEAVVPSAAISELPC